MTGFRVSSGGWWHLVHETEQWTPDLFTYGKVIGGGYPVAAVAGSAKVMDLLAPLGSVYQAGTLSGNPVATTAGLTTLQLCDDSLYDRLNQRAKEVSSVISSALNREGVAHQLQSAGNLFSFFFTDSPVFSFTDATKQDTEAFRPSFVRCLIMESLYLHQRLKRGLYLVLTPTQTLNKLLPPQRLRQRRLQLLVKLCKRPLVASEGLESPYVADSSERSNCIKGQRRTTDNPLRLMQSPRS